MSLKYFYQDVNSVGTYPDIILVGISGKCNMYRTRDETTHIFYENKFYGPFSVTKPNIITKYTTGRSIRTMLYTDFEKRIEYLNRFTTIEINLREKYRYEIITNGVTIALHIPGVDVIDILDFFTTKRLCLLEISKVVSEIERKYITTRCGVICKFCQ